jgi:hypothetical protein
MEIITRAEARDRGLSRYFTGKPCKHGHVATRKVCTGNCCECARLINLELMRSKRENATQRELINERRRVHSLAPKQIEAKRAADRKNQAIRYRKIDPETEKSGYQLRHKARQANEMLRLISSLRNTTAWAFRRRGYGKSKKTAQLLGCSWDEAKSQIERQFLSGMDWDNYGKWHFDHITPISTAKTKEDVIRLCHISNLRPMWAQENLSKSDTVTHLI